MDTNFGVKSTVREAWDILKREKKFLILFGVALIIVNLVLNGVSESFVDQGWNGANSLWSIVSFIVKMYTGLVTIIVSLKAVRGESLEAKHLIVTDKQLLWSYTLVSLLYGLVIMGGIILLIVPGIIFGIMYFLSTYLVVDQGLGVRESMKESKRLTSGYKGKLFLIGLATVGINILGVICLGVGVIVTAPLSMIMSGLVYEQLTHQSKPVVKKVIEKLPAQEGRKVDSDMSQYQI